MKKKLFLPILVILLPSCMKIYHEYSFSAFQTNSKQNNANLIFQTDAVFIYQNSWRANVTAKQWFDEKGNFEYSNGFSIGLYPVKPEHFDFPSNKFSEQPQP